MVMSSFLVGCNNENVINPGEGPINKEEAPKGKQSSIDWTIPEEIHNIHIPYNPTAYEAKVLPYTIAEDLSNIENINQFSGFTHEQKKMLSKSGFVVLPSRDTKIYYAYEENEYLGVPNFVTTDSVLHLYHQFFDKSLIFLEGEILYKDLEALTDRMLIKSIELLNEIKDEELKDIQKSNIAYFLIAKMLLEGDSNIEVSLDEGIMALANSEYALIQEAGGYGDSPLFNIKLDYSQFIVRGHYTRNENLEKFFKTMMWYGFTPIELMNLRTEELYYENTIKALLMTYTAFREYEGYNDIKAWNNIYEPTGFYVGQSDDINLLDMKDMIIGVFGEDVDINKIIDKAYYDKIHQGVKDLRKAEIVGSFMTKDETKSFKFMGQRYILDGHIMQELMDVYYRPVPNGLDVMGVLGSKYGEDLLFKFYEPQKQWSLYAERYNHLKAEIESYSDELWQKNLYNGWLWSIQKQLTEFHKDSGMPIFMTNDSWKSKSLNTALSSYAELKHDTVLYGKQPVAEMGGPLEFADQHYVEPNIELYDTLLWLMKYTVENLEARGLLNDSLKEGSKEYIKLLELLKSTSQKELDNEPLSEDEKMNLLWIGGVMENIINCYTYGSVSKEELLNGAYPIEKSAMLISDVATVPNHHYLSMGTGYFDHIYVVVPVEDKLYLTRGSVYSYYEFLSDKRLTDEEWWELHGLKTIKDSGFEYLEYGEPSSKLPAQPFWVSTFKSKTNNVDIEPLEVDWEKLNE